MRQGWVPISFLETNPAGLAAGSRWSVRGKRADHRENANKMSCTQKGCQNCCQPVYDLTRTETDSTSKRAVLASLQDPRISSTRVRGSFPLLPRNDPRLPATNPAGLDWSANGQAEPEPFSGRFRVRPHSRGNPGDITICDILAQAQVFKAGPCLYRTWRSYGRQHPQQPARSCHERLCHPRLSGMSKVITPGFEKLIDRLVVGGRFNNKSEVIRAGLRLLEAHEATAAANGDERLACLGPQPRPRIRRPATEIQCRNQVNLLGLLRTQQEAFEVRSALRLM
jgi:putative addiction module CopG family antidote